MNKVLLLPVLGFACGLLSFVYSIQPVDPMRLGSSLVMLFVNVTAFIVILKAGRKLALSAQDTNKK